MQELLWNICSNILANLIFWLSSGVMVALLVNSRRKKLNDFFGIAKNKKITVYLSSFIVKEYTVKDFRNHSRSYKGIGIPNCEFLEIPSITNLFTTRHLERIPDILSGFVDSMWIPHQPVIEFLPSPLNENEITPNNHICIGGPAFNCVTNYYLKTASPYFLIVKDDDNNWALRITRGRRTGEIIGHISDGSKWDYGIIQKLKDHDRKNSVFILAGLGVNGTRASVQYFISNWQSFYRLYRTEDFGIIVRCVSIDEDFEGYKRLEVIARLPD